MLDDLSRGHGTESAPASTLLSKIRDVELALDRLFEDAEALGAVANGQHAPNRPTTDVERGH